MKILEVAHIDFGLRQFVWPLMRAMRARGHQVIAACAEGDLLEPVRADGFDVRTVPMARSLDPRAQWRAFQALRALIRAEKPDLVHGHFPISGFLARAAAWAEGVPHIAYTCHGFLFHQPGPLWRRVLSFVVEWLGGKLARTFMTVSEEAAGDARRLRIHSRAVAVGNGRDPARFHPAPEVRARIRAELQTPGDAVVVVIVSRLVWGKGHPELLVALRDVPGAVLWVVGDRLPSDHGESLEPYFAQAGLGPRLVRLGHRDDVPDVLAAADIFALPSHSEGLPMSVIEAMLTGLPVVATDVRGSRELVVDGKTGVLVPPYVSAPLAVVLNRLVGDAALRKRLGQAGLERALEKYVEDKVIARTLDTMGL